MGELEVSIGGTINAVFLHVYLLNAMREIETKFFAIFSRRQPYKRYRRCQQPVYWGEGEEEK